MLGVGVLNMGLVMWYGWVLVEVIWDCYLWVMVLCSLGELVWKVV